MKKLSELVKLVENNSNCVVFEFKKTASMDLVKLGCFYGDETMFRITKAPMFDTHTATVWNKKGEHQSWSWGEHTTIVGDLTMRQGEMMRECVEKDFGIAINTKK